MFGWTTNIFNFTIEKLIQNFNYGYTDLFVFESHCWAKLKTIVFCAVEWDGRNADGSKLLKVASLDFAEDDELIREIKADYDFIRNKLIKKGFKSLTGKDGRWIQARTKGAGHGSTSRAFYARTALVKKIFEIAS